VDFGQVFDVDPASRMMDFKSPLRISRLPCLGTVVPCHRVFHRMWLPSLALPFEPVAFENLDELVGSKNGQCGTSYTAISMVSARASCGIFSPASRKSSMTRAIAERMSPAPRRKCRLASSSRGAMGSGRRNRRRLPARRQP